MVTNCYRILLNCLAVLFFSSLSAIAQDTRGTWQEALRLMDSASPADITAAIDKLQPLLNIDRTVAPPAEALLTLAMCQLHQQDYAATAKTLEQLYAFYPLAQQTLRRGASLRLSLISALVREDAPAADAAFKDLVRMVVAEQSDPIDLKLNAFVIGTVVGMLGVERARSPINPRVLQIGNEQLLLSKVRGVATGFQAALENSNERTEALVSHLTRIDKEGIEALTAELERRQAALKQSAAELAEQKELTGEVVRNTREQEDQNTRDIRQLATDINRIQMKLRQPTPGHPGPKRQPPPPLISPRLIAVDEYEVINDYDYVTQNGQTTRVPVTRTVRRPQYEIERDQDRIYRRLRDEYERTMANYRVYEAEYAKLLLSWQGEDERRKRDLNNEKADLEIKRGQLVAANKAINDDKKDSTKDLRIKRTATEQEEFEVELLAIAIDVYRQGKPQLAFRPPYFQSLNWSQEKVLLQKH